MMNTGKKLAKTSVGLTFIMLIAHIISFAKEAIIANYWGISYMVDAYTIAIQVPVLLFSFVSVAIQSVVIPVYSDIFYNKGKEQARKYLDHLLTLLIGITFLLVILGECITERLVFLFAPGFDDVTHQLSSTLLRISFPTIIMAVVGQVLIAILNVHKKFVWPSMAVFFMNISIIVSIVLLHSQYGIVSVCIGQLIGDFFRIIFLITISSKFYHYRYSFSLHDYEVRKTIKLSVPVFWSISVAEINAIVNRIVGSMLFVGSISAITYANKINTVLMQLFVSAIATIVYPLYAESSAKGDISQLNNRINLTMSAYALFVIPLMCAVFVFKKEVIEVAFARGVFDESAINLTHNLLGLYAIGMLFMALRTTITNVYYSLKDTKTPAVNATIGAVLNIILNIILPMAWGIQGIAIATSITAIYITTSLIFILVRKHKDIKLDYFFSNIVSIFIASFIMLGTCILIHSYIHWSSLWMLLLGTLIGIIIYLLMLGFMRVPIAFKLFHLIYK